MSEPYDYPVSGSVFKTPLGGAPLGEPGKPLAAPAKFCGNCANGHPRVPNLGWVRCDIHPEPEPKRHLTTPGCPDFVPRSPDIRPESLPVGTADPTGRDAHEPGAKLDAGKIRLALVMSGFAPALTEVGRVGTYGANKYTPNGWKDVPQAMERYQDAMLRHMTAYWGGEKDDPESHLPHLAHAAWNALAILTFATKEVRK